MKVRNRLYRTNEYKGQTVDCPFECCPCLRCFSIHDCGYRNSRGEYIHNFVCLTNYLYGCPDEFPQPVHLIKPIQRAYKNRTCMRCGMVFKPETEKYAVLKET